MTFSSLLARTLFMNKHTSTQSNTTGRFDDENIREEVHKLIVGEVDPKEKVRLLMMLQLNSTLMSNVVAVRNLTTEFKEHRLEFEAHVESEEKIINTGRGAIWAVIALIGFIQAISGYVFTQQIGKIDQIYIMANDDHTENKVQADKIKNLDDKFNRIMDKLDNKIDKVK